MRIKIDDLTGRRIEVHEGVTVQAIIPEDENEEASIAWTRDPEVIQQWKETAHWVTKGDENYE